MRIKLLISLLLVAITVFYCSPLLSQAETGSGVQAGASKPEELKAETAPVKKSIEVDEKEVVAVEQAPRRISTAEKIGRLHICLVHFPIAFIFLLLLIDYLTFIVGWNFEKFGDFLLVCLGLAFLPPIATGFLRTEYMKGNIDVFNLITSHRNLAISAAMFVLAALILRFTVKPQGIFKWIYLLVILAAAILVSMTGYEGGEVVFGEGYFSF